jgi:hypothetical protein
MIGPLFRCESSLKIGSYTDRKSNIDNQLLCMCGVHEAVDDGRQVLLVTPLMVLIKALNLIIYVYDKTISTNESNLIS